MPDVWPGADIPVPNGYYVTPSTASHTDTDPACLNRDSSRSWPDCDFAVISYQGVEVDADNDGGYAADPQYCPAAVGGTRTLTGFDSFTVDGRPVEYRAWTWSCNDGSVVNTAQFVVVTGPTYTWFTDQATPQIVAAMKESVLGSNLPPQEGSLRLYDYGIVASATPNADGSTTIELDRVVRESGVNNNQTTYTYVIPAGVGAAQATQEGQSVMIYTDGTTVTDAAVDD